MVSEDSTSNWKRVPLRDCCFRPEYGYTASAATKSIGPKFLRITDIQDGNVEWGKVPFVIRPDENAKSYLLEPGDIVIARIGATTGKAYFIRECPEAVFASYLIRVRTKPGLLPDFLNLCLQTTQYWQHIDSQKGGRLKGGVNIPILEDLEIPLPTPLEQAAIVRALDAVQKAKGARLRQVALERERKSALMEYLFTHGTGEEGGLLRKTRYGDVRADWQIVSLNECAFIQTGVAKGRKLCSNDLLAVPYLRVANVQDGYLDLTEMKSITIRKSELNRFLLQPGDIVLTEGGDFDKLGRGFIWHGEVSPCVHQNHIFAVRTNREMLMPEYLAYLVQSPYGKSYFLSVAHKTTNLASINKSKLGRFPTSIPTLREQSSIVNILRACDANLAALENEVKLLNELFQAILEALIAGRLSATALVEEHQTR